MKKAILVIMAAGCAALAIAYYTVWVTADREAPVIRVGNQKLIYVDGMTEEELIREVGAQDAQDGDVTESLKVEQVYGNPDGKSVCVVYAAKDSANNVAKKKVVYQRRPSETDQVLSESGTADGSGQTGSPEQTAGQAGEPGGTDTSGQAGGAGGTDVSGQAGGAGGTDTSGQAGEPGSTDPSGTQGEPTKDAAQMPEGQRAEMEQMDASRPRLYLKVYQTEAALGSSFQGIEYVKEITDDKDTREELWEQIQIAGEVDTASAGVYELEYVVRDSDGNYSNSARLTVTVS